MTNEALRDLIKAVRDHALDNYETGGWDYVVECWEDADIGNEIREGDTAERVIYRIGEIVAVLDERRAEIVAEIF